jgi:hypothetical protein
MRGERRRERGERMGHGNKEGERKRMAGESERERKREIEVERAREIGERAKSGLGWPIEAGAGCDVYLLHCIYSMSRAEGPELVLTPHPMRRNRKFFKPEISEFFRSPTFSKNFQVLHLTLRERPRKLHLTL